MDAIDSIITFVHMLGGIGASLYIEYSVNDDKSSVILIKQADIDSLYTSCLFNGFDTVVFSSFYLAWR